ncbi:MAG: hypothetical protein E6Q96_03770, partial [Cyclobacteriaceae bacterium]
MRKIGLLALLTLITLSTLSYGFARYDVSIIKPHLLYFMPPSIVANPDGSMESDFIHPKVDCPISYSLSGSGVACTVPGGDAPATISQGGSQSGITYRIYWEGNEIGTQTGNGLGLSWYVFQAGYYTVSGEKSGCAITWMNGGVGITIAGVNPPPAHTATLSNGGAYCPGDAPLTVTLPVYEANVGYYLYLNTTTLIGSITPTSVGAPLVWTGLTQYGTYSILAFGASQCPGIPMTWNGTSTIGSTGTPSTSVTLGVTNNGEFCTGGVTVSLTGTVEAGSVYQLIRNGVVVPGSAQTGTASWLVTESGLYKVEGKKSCGNFVPLPNASAQVSVSKLNPEVFDLYPYSPNNTITLCPGMSGKIRLTESNNGVSYQLKKNGVAVGSPIAGTNEPITWSRSDAGTYTVEGTFTGGGQTGCTAVTMNGSVIIGTPSESAKKTQDFFTHTQLSVTTPVSKKLFLNRCEELNGECTRTLKKLKVYVRFDLGDVYKWGKYSTQAAYTGTTNFTLRGLDKLGAVSFTTNRTLEIIKDATSIRPEQVYYYEVTTGLADLREIELIPAANPGGYNFSNGFNTADIRLKFYYEEEFETNVAKSKISVVGVNAISGNPWEKEFDWNLDNSVSCQNVNNYQVQVLKLNPGQASSSLLEKDWMNSLNMETASSATALRLVLSEGSGNYAWRVRAIGSLDGGITNPLNWGSWSSTGVLTNFVQPEEDTFNWIYSRTFTEGNEISESLVYANGLQQISQRQTRLQSIGPAANGSSDQLVATQTVRDFTGRDAVTTLPIPVGGVSAFGYRANLITAAGVPFRAQHFDTDNPNLPSDATVEGGYYSGDGQTVDGKLFNDRVPDAEGVPYSRTLFTQDGTGRVKEQGGPGGKNSLKGGKTVKTYYAGASEGELVRMFGADAPEPGNVQKIVTLDANGIASVTFKNKDGKIIATALDGSDAAPARLDALSTHVMTPTTTFEEIKEEIPYGPWGSSSKKSLFFTAATTVKVDYSITPQVIAAICGSACTTCDYKVDFILHNLDAQGVGLPETTLLTVNIPGTLSCSATPTTISQIVFTANANTNYVLEKRVTTNTPKTGTLTYLDDYINASVAANTTAINTTNTHLYNIRTFLSNNDLAGLNAYLTANLQSYYDPATNRYALTIHIGGGCTSEVIYIPKEALCESPVNITGTSPCKSNNLDFEAYFNSYWNNNDGKTYYATGTGTTGVLYFTNKYKKELGQAITTYQVRFGVGQFNTMMQNLLGDNPLITCQMAWDVWVDEVQAYDDYVQFGATQATEPIEGLDGETFTFENNLLDRFLLRLDEKLAETYPGDRPQCVGGNAYFIKKVNLYGRPLSTEVVPPITSVSNYIYYNSANASMASASTNYLAGRSFSALNDCEKFTYAQALEYGQFVADTNPEKEKRRLFAISKCKDNCEARREEFRQAIFNNILTQNPSATFEHYFVSLGADNRYVAVYDTTVNDGVSVTFTECQIDALTEALVRNCQNNYCNLAFTGINNNTLGLTAEIDKIKQVLQYDFDVQVNPVGTGCSAGWDNIPGPLGPYSNNVTYWGFKHPDTYSRATVIANDLSLNQILWRDVSGSSVITSKLEKYSSSGAVLWSKNIITYTGASILMPGDAEVDAAGNIIIAGQIGVAGGAVDFDPANAGGTVNLSSSSWYAYFIAKYDASGNFIWVKTIRINEIIGTPSDFLGFKTFLEIDGSNNIFVSASLIGTMDFDPSASTYNLTATGTQPGYSWGKNTFIARYNSSGSFLQAKALYATNHQEASDFERDTYGNLYIYGYGGSTGTIDFDPDAPNTNTSVGSTHYIAKYSSALVFTYVNGIAPVSSGSGDRGQLTIDLAGNIYVTGVANGLYDFDLTTGSYPLGNGGFLAKYTSAGNFEWAKIINVNPYLKFYDAEYENTTNSVNIAGTFLLLSPNQPKLFFYKASASGGFIGEFEIGNSGNPYGSTPFDINPAGSAIYLAASISGNATLDIDITSATNNITGNFQSFFAKYYVKASTGCLTSNSMCFKFTTARSEITIPADLPTKYVFDPVETPCNTVKSKAVSDNIEGQIRNILDRRRDYYASLYKSTCADPSKLNDQFKVTVEQAQGGLHHYTLYYYDRAGNLVKTVPPEGVYAEPPAYGWSPGGGQPNPASLLQDVSTQGALITARATTPQYRLVTEYQYNSLGQLIRQHTPDGNGDPAVDTRPLVSATESVKNASKYYTTLIYDDLGRLRFSQNAKQKAAATFSYTKYDELSRPIESGQATGFVEATVLANRNVATYPSTGKSEMVVTVYSTAYPNTPALPSGYNQRFLRNRVSYVFTDDDGNPATTADLFYTIYSYDPHGNVEWIVQSMPELYASGQTAMIGMKYEYDLLNGQVKQLSYNPGMEDQFFHRYQYDADKRIKTVLTSKDGKLWEKDARYTYYAHGPLKRT